MPADLGPRWLSAGMGFELLYRSLGDKVGRVGEGSGWEEDLAVTSRAPMSSKALTLIIVPVPY